MAGFSWTWFFCTCALMPCVDLATTASFTTSAPFCSASSKSSHCCLKSPTESCPEAFFQDTSHLCSSGILCQPCQQTCGSCTGSADNCTSCRMQVGNIASNKKQNTANNQPTTFSTASTTAQSFTLKNNSTITTTIPRFSNPSLLQQKDADRLQLEGNCSTNLTGCPRLGVCPRGTFYLNASDLGYSNELVCVCNCPADMYLANNRTTCVKCSENDEHPCKPKCTSLEENKSGKCKFKWYIPFVAALGSILFIAGIVSIPVCLIRKRQSIARNKGKEERLKELTELGNRPQSGRYVDGPSHTKVREPSTVYDNYPSEVYDVPTSDRRIENSTIDSEEADGGEVYGNQEIIREHQNTSALEGDEVYGNQAVIDEARAASANRAGGASTPGSGLNQSTSATTNPQVSASYTHRPQCISTIDEPIYVNTRPQEDDQPVYVNFQNQAKAGQSTNLDDDGEEYKDMSRSASLAARPEATRKTRALNKARPGTVQHVPGVQLPTRTPMQTATPEEDSSDGEEYQLMESSSRGKVYRQQSQNEYSQETYGFREAPTN